MKNVYQYKDLTWIDAEKPTKDEIRELMEKYNIPAMAAEELISPSLKPKVDFYKDWIYLVLHFPDAKHGGTKINREVDFLMSKNTIITTRYGHIDAMNAFAKTFEMNSTLNKDSVTGDHSGYIFYEIIKGLYRSMAHELDSIRDSLDQAEKGIFKGKEREMVAVLSGISRQLLSFRRAMALHNQVLESFELAGKQLFGEGFDHYLRAITSEYYKIENSINDIMGLLDELRETNNSLLSTKQNEIMKVITIIAFTSLPISVLTSLFQIDSVSRPIIGQPGDFWIFTAILIFVGACMLLFFKLKKWL